MTALTHAALHSQKMSGVATEVKVADTDQGIVETVVSVTAVLDDVNDVIEPGAYADTLSIRLPKSVWAHDWDIWVAKTLTAEELMPGDPRLPAKIQALGGGGLYVKTQFNLKTQAGRDAFENVKFFGDACEWSIGFIIPPGGATVDKKTGIRHIFKLDLFEYSPVLFGANPYTVTMSIKGALAPQVKGVSTALWDAVTNVNNLRPEAGSEIFKAAFAWVDSDKDPESKTSYGLPHHFISDDGRVGAASTKACLSLIESLNMNTSYPDDDRKGIFSHLSKHLREAGIEEIPALKSFADDGSVVEGKPCHIEEQDAAAEKDAVEPTASNEDNPGAVVAPHAYSPGGGPSDDDEESPCLVCGQDADAPIHTVAGEVATVEDESSTEKAVVTESVICTGRFDAQTESGEVTKACQKLAGHEESCGFGIKGVHVSTDETKVAEKTDDDEVVSIEIVATETDTDLAKELEENSEKTAPETEVKEIKGSSWSIDGQTLPFFGLSLCPGCKSMTHHVGTIEVTHTPPGEGEKSLESTGSGGQHMHSVGFCPGCATVVTHFGATYAAPGPANTGVVELTLSASEDTEQKVYVSLPGTFEDILNQVYEVLDGALPAPSGNGNTVTGYVEATWPDRLLVQILEFSESTPDGSVDEDGDVDVELVDSYYVSISYTLANGQVSLGSAERVDVGAVVIPSTNKSVIAGEPLWVDALKAAEKALDAIESKVGRTLSAANAQKIKDAVIGLIDVLGAAGIEVVDPAPDDTKGAEEIAIVETLTVAEILRSKALGMRL